MSVVPFFTREILCIYVKEKELICSWFSIEKEDSICKAVEKFLSPTKLIIDGVMFNQRWLFETIAYFVDRYQVSQVPVILSFENRSTMHYCSTAGQDTHDVPEPFFDTIMGSFEWKSEQERIIYHAHMSHLILLQYKIFMLQLNLYTIACVTPAWAILHGAWYNRNAAADGFGLLQDFSGTLEHCTNLLSGNMLYKNIMDISLENPLTSEDAVISSGLYSIGKALYEAV